MTKILVLAEKPSVGRDIARVLHCSQKLNGALEGKQYIVTWALGHLVTLADPEVYDGRYQNWQIDDLPIMPEKMKLVVIGKTSRQFQAVQTQMKRADVGEIVIATDAGREGELVARWILAKAGIHKPLKRLWISSVTDKAILEGFKHLKDAKAYEPLYQSAQARSTADWLVGINATRALTCKYNAQLSCGRVQTPTLAMVSHREEEIRHFVARPFYGLKIRTGEIEWTWQSKRHQTNVWSQVDIQTIIHAIDQQKLRILDIKKKNKKVPSPLLYDLTELQKDANRLYGYSAKETLNIMQNLYEYHKVLTYPRTDSRYLTDDIVPTIKERLTASLGNGLDPIIEQILTQPIVARPHYVNNQRVSDHHAIIPTEQEAYSGTFSEAERKIYMLVLKRFLSVLCPPYIYEETLLTATVNDQIFVAKGRTVQQKGWRSIYDSQLVLDEEENDSYQQLPVLKNGQIMSIDRYTMTTGATQPPARFTEATLLAAMENPVRFMQGGSSQQLTQTLINTGGLGTVATRADIIDKLLNTFLIEKRGQDIFLTAKGKQLLALVPSDLRSPELTAKWELELAKIAQGKAHSNHFLKNIQDYTQQIIQEIKTTDGQFKHDNLTSKKCPECGHFLLEVNGKRGKSLVCSNRECHYKETISINTNARCPECHKKMELVGKGEKQMFVCKNCGYRQQMTAFKKEREQKQQAAGKNDIKKYMQQQKKQQQTSVADSPFAALLALKENK